MIVTDYKCRGCLRSLRECEHNVYCRACTRSWQRRMDSLKKDGLDVDAYQGMIWSQERIERFHHLQPKRIPG